MHAPTPDEQLIEYYSSGYDEASRLTQPDGRLEFVRTRELLRRVLPPPPARVLDVGGATGIHAEWLARDGYAVTLIDVVDEHVRQARALADRLGFEAKLGDARHLDEPDASADACLLLGPLYHLPDRGDRVQALAEAVRVCRTGGLVAAAAISRYAWPLDALRQHDLSDRHAAAMREVIDTGRHNPEKGFTTAYMHRPGELVAELSAAGLLGVSVAGVEGPGWTLFGPEISDEDAAGLLAAAVRAACLCDGDPDMAAVSPHLLGTGRRP